MPLNTRALNGLPKQVLRNVQLTITRFPFIRWILTHFSCAVNLGGKKRRQMIPGVWKVFGSSKSSLFNLSNNPNNTGGRNLVSIFQSLPWISSNLVVSPDTTKKPKLSILTLFILRSHFRQQKKTGKPSMIPSLVNVSCFEAETIRSPQKKHMAQSHKKIPQCRKETPEGWTLISTPQIIPTKFKVQEWQTQKGSRKLEQVQKYLNSKKAIISPTSNNPFKVLENLSEDDYQVPQYRKHKNPVKCSSETFMENTSSILSDTATLVDSANSPLEEQGKKTTNSLFSTGNFQTFGLKEIPSLIPARKPPTFTTEYEDLDIALLIENRRLNRVASRNHVLQIRKNSRFVPIKETPETFRNASNPPRLPFPIRTEPDEWQVQGKRSRKNLNPGKIYVLITQEPKNTIKNTDLMEGSTKAALPETTILPVETVFNVPY